MTGNYIKIENIKNFEDLLKASIPYLSDKIGESFDHEDHLDTRGIITIEDLESLCEKGVLILDSQPHEIIHNYKIEYGEDKGKFADMQQKQYIKCIVRNSDVEKIIPRLQGKNLLYNFTVLNDCGTISNWVENEYTLSRDRVYETGNPLWECHHKVGNIQIDSYLDWLYDFPHVYDIVKRQCTGLLIFPESFEHAMEFPVSCI